MLPCLPSAQNSSSQYENTLSRGGGLSLREAHTFSGEEPVREGRREGRRAAVPAPGPVPRRGSCPGSHGAGGRAAAALRTKPPPLGCCWERGAARTPRGTPAAPLQPRDVPGPPPVPRSDDRRGRQCEQQYPAGSNQGRNTCGGTFRGDPPQLAVRAELLFLSQPAAEGHSLPGGASELRHHPRSPSSAPSPGLRGVLRAARRFSPTSAAGKQKPPSNSTGGPAPSCQTGPAAGGGRAERRCHWRGAGRPSPPGGGGGGRLEAGPRGAVAPVGARRAAVSLLLLLPRRTGSREPDRGWAAGPEPRGELAAAPSGLRPSALGACMGRRR